MASMLRLLEAEAEASSEAIFHAIIMPSFPLQAQPLQIKNRIISTRLQETTSILQFESLGVL